ncbi:cytochrome P450 monooxygenase [Moelleriella libera RCEF 2490]|uniref:Cytochrome P450 monooxygenase n=1 Tax=Moelleriella libera RCEF 2490 TaxID=1081109 RepID=A0A162IBR8_9HYPO|nr:cytochrome P450 monooxygenase [Moelleriella libera RCEF 2490]
MQTIGKAQHAAKRKVLNLSFTEKSIKSTSEFVFKHIDRWHELMVDNDNWSVPFDLSDSVHNLLFDVQGDICFGASFNTKEPGENAFRKMPHMILEIMLLYYPLVRSPLRGLLLWLKSLGLDNLLERYSPPGLKDFNKFVHDSVTKRIKYQEELRQNPEIQERLDMFHYLCEARDPDSGQFVHDEHSLRAEAALVMVAGSDTTATIFTATMFYLSLPSQAHRLQKVVNEIRSTFDAAEDIKTGPQLSSCTYLLACIEEAMRLAPAAPSELPRVVREGGAVIKGEFYPAGTIVGTSNYVDGRNEQFYEDCQDYRPERWIVSDHVSHEEVARARSNFRPFGSGPLNCAGKKLAMIELLALVGRTLWRFDMRRAPGARLTLGGGSPDLGWGQRDPDQFRLIDAYMTLHEGPMLQLRKRVN